MGGQRETFSWSKDNGYYSHATIGFFSELLTLIDGVRSVGKETGWGSLKFLLLDESKRNIESFHINLAEDDSSEQLANLLLSFYADQEAREICCERKGTDGSSLPLMCVYEKDSRRTFRVKSTIRTDIERINMIKGYLDETFLDAQSRERLQSKLDCLIGVYSAAQECGDLLLPRKCIFEILNAYYGLLVYFLNVAEARNTEMIREKVLIPLLNLGIEWEEDKGVVNMTAPVMLSALNVIYDQLKRYLEMDVQDGTDSAVFHEIFLSKIHQVFRFFLVREKDADECGSLYHAAVPAYMDKDSGSSVLSAYCRSISQYNSFEGIREIRLAEKILYELSRVKDANAYKDQRTAYRITIIGDIWQEPMMELVGYVRDVLTSKDEYSPLADVRIDYRIYTRNNWKSTDEPRISIYDICHREDYTEQLIMQPALRKILDEAELFFFLDNCDLYKMKTERMQDMLAFRQSISAENYEQYYTRNRFDDLTLDCKFMELYNVFTVFGWHGEMEYLKKQVRVDIVKYIRSVIASNANKSAYMYFSDLGALKEVSCIQGQVVRIELYHQKTMGIVYFTYGKQESFPVSYSKNGSDNRKILVFNMWQFVKHIVLNRREEFEELIIKGEFRSGSYKHFLDEIYVGIDYTDWRNNVVISYWAGEEGIAEDAQMTDFLQKIILTFSPDAGEDMYQRYIKKAFISFLYGAAKSVEDLIFLHILKRNAVETGEWNLEASVVNAQLTEYYNLNCKYSYKKIYWEAIEKYDSGTATMVDEYMISMQVKESGLATGMEHTDPVEEFHDNIRKACSSISYEDSALFKYYRRLADASV